MSNLELLLEEGLSAMVIGMGVVFSFLIILVISMGIMSKVVLWLNTIFPEKVVEVAKKVKKAAKGSDDAEVAVAIAVANSRR